VSQAASRLRYRDFLTVALIVDRKEVFPDNWIYIHSPKVRVGRIQNFKNWSPDMVPDPALTSLGLEYFVQEGDELWSARDEELIALARQECAALGLVRPDEILDGTVVRIPKAYPVYDAGYQEALARIRGWLEGLPNLQLVGRNGQHRYNNQDHSMLTALYAVRNLAGASHDVWDVNVDAEYHEGVRAGDRVLGERLVPEPLGADAQAETVRQAFARYDALALAGAVAIVLGVASFLVTAIPLLRGSEELIPMLSLLGNYLFTYSANWSGALLGMLEAGALGAVVGFALARTINTVVALHERRFLREIEFERSLDFFDGQGLQP
jgi:hypothetical protein